MKKIILLIFVTVSNIINSQIDTTKWEFLAVIDGDTIYSRKPTKATIARDNGDFELAISEYRKLMQSEPNETEHTYNLSCIYAIINKKDSAFKYLFMATHNDSTAYPATDPDFYNLLNDKRWLEFENIQQAKVLKAHNFKYKDLNTAKEFWRMKIKDQAFYEEIEIYDKKLGMNNPKSDSLWKIKEKLNNDNVRQLEQIIQKYGWPKASEFGGRASEAAFLVIQHSDINLQKKYLPMIEEAAKNKESDWQNVALMTDRILTSENKSQKYGSQVKYNEQTKKYEIFPLEDPANVDKRRASVGLGSLKDYVARWGIVFDVEQNK